VIPGVWRGGEGWRGGVAPGRDIWSLGREGEGSENILGEFPVFVPALLSRHLDR